VAGDLRWGVFVTIAAADRFVAAAFAAYGLATSGDGRVAALWRPAHLVGLELGTSVARAVLAGEPTGAPRAALAAVSCRAKRDLRVGETIDGEGGAHVYGVLQGASEAASVRALPMGLARGARLLRDVARGGTLSHADVELAATGEAGTLYGELARELQATSAQT
jgi:predicted homoserine dehydrogenase-like protein